MPGRGNQAGSKLEERQEPVTAAKFIPGFLQEAKKALNQEHDPEDPAAGAGVTWARGNTQQIRERRKAYREKERRKTKFDVEKPPGKAAGAGERSLKRKHRGDSDGRMAKQNSNTGTVRKEEPPFPIREGRRLIHGGIEMPELPEPEQEGKVCSVTQLRSWIKAQRVEKVYMIKLEKRPGSSGADKTRGPEASCQARCGGRQAKR